MFLLLWLSLQGHPIDLVLRPCCLLPHEGSLYVELHIPSHPENREWTLQVDNGDTYGRFSTWPMEGAEAPKQYSIRYGDLPDGCYLVTARLYRVTNGESHEVSMARAHFSVASSCGEDGKLKKPILRRN